MGSISRFNLDRIIHDFKTPFFFETGTFRGDGVSYATSSPFREIWSVEIVPGLAEAARRRFEQDRRVTIIENDSLTALRQSLSKFDGNCIFWLDAHFPGADAGMTAYDAAADEKLRLPLPLELEVIQGERPGFHDVLILDDLRIYEDGPYENGNVPPDALPQGVRNTQFVTDLYDKTHYILRSYRDEGYLLLFPRKQYWRRHFILKNLLGKPLEKADQYFKSE
jgi:hypothetical protein